MCTPSDMSEFESYKLSELIHQITLDNCESINKIMTIAHDVDDMYVFETAKILFILMFIIGFISYSSK
jgi:hypothetical protein